MFSTIKFAMVVGCFLSIQSLFSAIVVTELGHYQQKFHELFQQVEQPINQIIKEELDKAFVDKKRTPPFYPTISRPGTYHMTLLYLYGLKDEFDDAIISSLNVMQMLKRGIHPVSDVSLTGEFDFFGRFKNFLVIKVRDAKGTLYKLHYDIKQMLQLIYTYFSRGSNQLLFNLEKSNEYHFSPHVTIANFPIRKIKQVLHLSKSESDLILDTMRQRIDNEVLRNLSVPDQDLQITSFSFWGGKNTRNKVFSISREETQNNGIIDTIYSNVSSFMQWLKKTVSWQS